VTMKLIVDSKQIKQQLKKKVFKGLVEL